MPNGKVSLGDRKLFPDFLELAYVCITKVVSVFFNTLPHPANFSSVLPTCQPNLPQMTFSYIPGLFSAISLLWANFLLPVSVTGREPSYEEYGKATYYSKNLEGRATASGEKYRPDLLTCAHKTLPFGTRIRVTRLDNKLSVIVRVNDRGSFRAGYVVDLSYQAAVEISLVNAGVAPVKIETVAEEQANPGGVPATYPTNPPKPVENHPSGNNKDELPDTPRPLTGLLNLPAGEQAAPSEILLKIGARPAQKSGFAVQVSHFYDANNLIPMLVKLEKLFPGRVLVRVAHDPTLDQYNYSVFIGRENSRQKAEKLREALLKNGYQAAFIVNLEE